MKSESMSQIDRWDGFHTFKEEIGRWHGGSRGLERLRAAISGEGAAGGE
jgi:hypothetical protein